jgi:hypothetical protein
MLEKHRLIANHEHEWLFGHGGGNGVKCAIGPGRHLRSSFESTNVAAFVEALTKYTDQQTVSKWLTRLQNPELSHACLRAADYPRDDAFGSEQLFKAWLNDGPEERLYWEETGVLPAIEEVP